MSAKTPENGSPRTGRYGPVRRDPAEALIEIREAAQELDRYLNIQFELCIQLEKLADSLPDRVDTQTCLRLAHYVYPIMHRSHSFEEAVLFPMLSTRMAENRPLNATLDRLRHEHWEDESFADEIRDSLVCFVTNRSSSNIDTLSYMLRGFFEGLRRHLAFEREHVLPLVISLDKRR